MVDELTVGEYYCGCNKSNAGKMITLKAWSKLEKVFPYSEA